MSKIDEKPVKTDLKTIRKAFDALSFVTGGSCRDFVADFLAQCKQEEKSHRGWGPSFDKYHPNAATIADCAKLFAVKRVAEIMTTGKMPDAGNYLHMQKSCFFAAGLCKDFQQEIAKAWDSFDMNELAALDYRDFVKVV